MTRDLNESPISERWGRWLWSDTGTGRWHALADFGIGQTQDGTKMAACTTACGRIRSMPSGVTDDPRKPICPTCQALDGLRGAYQADAAPADQPEPEKVPVRVKAPALSEDIPMPMFPETDGEPQW